MQKWLTACFIFLAGMPGETVYGQTKKVSDSIPVRVLQNVTVNTTIRDTGTYLPDVLGVAVFAGKKTNWVKPDGVCANLAQNNIRQAFAKIPGLTSWDMDGAGTQLNIGSRGTDSHRSIEMNMRQNGYNTNSDIFGYPENHYTPPLQAIREIQLVRGSAALQFGSQFGGMMNFVMKEGDSTKPISLETEQTRGSNNFYNAFTAIGGTSGKFNYYAYYDDRHGDGWRANAAFSYHAYYAAIRYRFSEKGSIALQFSRMDYRQQISGGLTDLQFQQNARQSERSRNYFSPEINLPAVIFRYAFSKNTRLNITSNWLLGQRNSVQFINPPNIADTINAQTGTLNHRQVDRDYYTAWATEARLLHRYKIGGIRSVLSAGLRYSRELTQREQQGLGSIGADYNLAAASYGIDLRFRTHNYAGFAENIFNLGKRLSVTPGFRYEVIRSELAGVIQRAAVPVSYTGNRSFPLFGMGLQYQAGKSAQVYGNVSQAYRPYLYSLITPADRVDVVDPSLKDSKGYDIDLGYRGSFQNLLQFDVNLFYLLYGNRVGLITRTDAANRSYLYTTNIGDAVSKGAEAYVELSVSKLFNPKNTYTSLVLFESVSYTHAVYTKGMAVKNGINTSLAGNRIENTPEWMTKTGLQFQKGKIATSLQYSYTANTYNDALNTVYSGNGVTGVVPAYQLWDWSVSVSLKKHYRLSAGINNLGNEKYFNRRITFYPGPGILPADGRTFYFSVSFKL